MYDWCYFFEHLVEFTPETIWYWVFLCWKLFVFCFFFYYNLFTFCRSVQIFLYLLKSAGTITTKSPSVFAEGFCVLIGRGLQHSDRKFTTLPWLSLPAHAGQLEVRAWDLVWSSLSMWTALGLLDSQKYVRAFQYPYFLKASHSPVFPPKAFGYPIVWSNCYPLPWQQRLKHWPVSVFNKWPWVVAFRVGKFQDKWDKMPFELVI